MRFFARLRILPLLVLVALLSFTVRIGEFWTGLHRAGEAMAQEKVNAEPPPMPATAATDSKTPAEQAALDAAVKNAQGGAAPDAPPAAGASTAGKGPPLPAANSGQKVQWRDSSDETAGCSDSQDQLNQDLAKRREQLDKQSKELETRQALLVAAQHELDQKVVEITNLRNEIKGMMGTLSDQEQARIKSLVKIYENMKPADAARIFNTLDMDVLIQVMSQMKEAKASPVLAAMDADRAKTVTVMLAQQKKLPDVPPVPTAP